MRIDPLFRRSETRRWAREYVNGLLMDLERKNCWQIAEGCKIQPDELQALQHFLYGSTWVWTPVIEEMGRLVDEHMGSDDGLVVVDESGVRRWGDKSVGIARQYIGNVGKVDNGQVGVYLTYASEHGQAFIDTRLYLPEEWLTKPQRCKAAGIPQGTIFRTKPELAAAMVEGAVRRGLRARWLTADEAYGQDPVFLDTVDSVGWLYVVEVPVNLKVWKERPKVLLPTPPGKAGRPRKKTRLSRESRRPATVKRLAANLRRNDWQRFMVADGTKGRRIFDFAFLRIVEKRKRLPGRDAWLMIRRSLDQTPEIKYFLSNAPADAEKERMMVVGSERWRVENCIKEAKGQTSLDESEGRNWNHWHHHTTLSMLAHAFLTCARVRWNAEHFPPLGTQNAETRRSRPKGAAA